MKRAALALSLLLAATLNAQRPADPSTSKPLTPAAVVNINTATPAQLEYLPDIGKVMAGRIADYRAQHGQFRQTSDLLRVKGIGDKKLAKMLPFVTVARPTTASAKIKAGAK